MNLVRTFLLLSCVNVLFSQAAVEGIKVAPAVAVVRKDFHVWEINRATVEAQKIVIKNYLRENSKMRVFVRGAIVAAAAAALGYYFYKPSVTPDIAKSSSAVQAVAEKPVISESIDASVSISKETVKGLQKNMQVLAEHQIEQSKKLDQLLAVADGAVAVKAAKEDSTGVVGKVKDGVVGVASGSYHLAKEIGLFFLTNLPSTIAACFVNMLILKDFPTLLEAGNTLLVRPIKKVLHPVSSKWFLVTQVNLDRVFKNLTRTAAELPLASNDFERGHYVTSVATDTNLMTRQLARVIAFCEIQTDNVMVNNKTCGKHLKEATAFIFKLTQQFSKDMARLLASQESHAEVPAVIDEFHRKIHDELRSYEIYEQAAYYDIIPS